MLGPAGSVILALQSQQLASSAKQLLASAQSGGFGFQPEAANTLITALRESIDDLRELNDKLILISQAPKLGRTPAALVVSRLTQEVATDDQGVVRAVDNLRQMFKDMIAAYEEAKNRYDETDTIAAQRLRRLHR